MSALTRPPALAYADRAATLLAAGFGDPNQKLRRTSATKTIAGAFFVPAVHRYGGCAWETFGSAGFLSSRFANLRTVTTHLFGDRRGDSSNSGVSPMSNHAQGASAPSLLSRSLAAAHRRMALAALRADSSASVRLARYNAHMAKARSLEVAP